MKRSKKRFIAIPVILIVILLFLAFCGYQWSWGPFIELHNIKTSHFAGNAEEYALDNVKAIPDSPLKNKNIIFLGSSVTYGSASMGVTFADYIGARNDCNIVKEAVSGTTLVESGINSYISRLKKMDTEKADIFVCQLSTNDATQGKALGEISSSFDINDFDTKTVAGAIEYIISYAKEKWHCPVVFYTSPYYESSAYSEMVQLLSDIQEKWGIVIIDMWNDADINNKTSENKALYMADSIHPTQAGYLELWAPYFEENLYPLFD